MKIKVDFSKNNEKFKPMHGVGQPPFSGLDYSMMQYLTDAGVPFSRLHDVGGTYGGGRFVDIPNIFRDFSADEEDPASYDFAFTDSLIAAIVEHGIEPFFRLGVTIENYISIKAYRINPPSDMKKWAVICEKIIRHYTEGWADGFHYRIRYWEIWNEPENNVDPSLNEMWSGTKEEYYKLYETTSKHLKKCFPDLKIGGYASCGFYALNSHNPRNDYFIEFLDGFLNYIKANECPLDFFSWHSYDNIQNTVKYASYARKRLDEAGYPDTETTCNEWNCEPNTRGSFRHSANTMGMMLALQDSPLDSAMFYDARFGTSIYGGLFNPLTTKPFPSYYAFAAFNELYSRGSEYEVTGTIDGVYAAAAYDKDGCLVIANTTESSIPLEIDGFIPEECRIIGDGKIWEDIRTPEILAPYTVLCIKGNK